MKNFNIVYRPSSNNNIDKIEIHYSVVNSGDDVIFKPYFICITTYLFGDKVVEEELLYKYLNTYELNKLEELVIKEYTCR